MDIQKVRHIRTVSANAGVGFEEYVNELLSSGNYVLLHVGFEVAHDDKGHTITPTMAVLGSEQPAPPKPEVIIGRAAR